MPQDDVGHVVSCDVAIYRSRIREPKSSCGILRIDEFRQEIPARAGMSTVASHDSPLPGAFDEFDGRKFTKSGSQS